MKQELIRISADADGKLLVSSKIADTVANLKIIATVNEIFLNQLTAPKKEPSRILTMGI